MQKPGLGELRLRGDRAVEDDEVVGRNENELAHHQGALLGVVLRRGVTGHVGELRAGFEGHHLRPYLLVLPPCLLEHLAVPVGRGRLAGHLDEEAVVSDGLGVVVLQVVRVTGPGAGVQGQETVLVDGEMGGVIVPVVAGDAATGEECVGIVLARP